MARPDEPGVAVRHFRWLVAAAAVGGLVVRLLYVAAQWRREPPGVTDEAFYRVQAAFLAHGHGFLARFDVGHLASAVRWGAVSSSQAEQFRQLMATYGAFAFPVAGHAPLEYVVLAVADVFGATSYGAQLVVEALIGAVTIVVIALVARRVGGARTAVAAAALAALAPSIWVYDGEVLAEAAAVLVAACCLLSALRFVDRPGWARAAWLGATCGLAALARSELVLLVVLVGWVAVWLAHLGASRGLAMVGVVTAAAAVVVAPWAIRNTVEYGPADALSNQTGVLLAQANCDPTYYQSVVGYWDWDCYGWSDILTVSYAQMDSRGVSQAGRYVEGHLSRVPAVLAARLGRMWGFYEPDQQAQLNSLADNWTLGAADLEIVTQYGLLALAVLGAVLVGRARHRLLLSSLVVAAIVASVGFAADARFRAVAEVSLVVFGAVAIERLAPRRFRRRRAPSAAVS